MSLSYLRAKQGFNPALDSFSSSPSDLSMPSSSRTKTIVASVKLPGPSKRAKKSSSESRPFSEKELANLVHGVVKYGKIWNRILVRYDFHRTRNSGDLRRAYLNIKGYPIDRSENITPEWSVNELNQLKLCITNHGNDCVSCSDCSRSSKDLRNKRELVKNHNIIAANFF